MNRYLPDHVHCKGERFHVLLTEEEIQKRTAEIGSKLARQFEGKRPIFIGVLNGAFIFLSDLMRLTPIPCEVDFIKLSSYGDEKVSSGEVIELKEINADLTGRDVILVEDIVDTGLSITFLADRLNSLQPASLTLVTLLHKVSATTRQVTLDHVGFEIPDRFVLGYGLDFSQEGRNLAQIYIQEDEV